MRLPGSRIRQIERLQKYHGDKAAWVLGAWIDTWLAEGPSRIIVVLDLADTEAQRRIDAGEKIGDVAATLANPNDPAAAPLKTTAATLRARLREQNAAPPAQHKASVVHHADLPKVTASSSTDWSDHNGDAANSRYSPLDQINASNFGKLEVAWRFKTDSLGPRAEFQLQATPLVIDGIMYSTAGTRRAVVALDAKTGELITLEPHPEQLTLGGAA